MVTYFDPEYFADYMVMRITIIFLVIRVVLTYKPCVCIRAKKLGEV